MVLVEGKKTYPFGHSLDDDANRVKKRKPWPVFGICHMLHYGRHNAFCKWSKDVWLEAPRVDDISQVTSGSHLDNIIIHVVVATQ